MPNILESRLFIAGHRLPTEPLWVSGSTAYATMVKAEVGGLIALDGRTPRFLVTARFVKSALDFAARSSEGRAASVIPLSVHLRQYWTPKSDFFDFVGARFKEAGLSADHAVVDIGEATLSHRAGEPTGGPIVQQVLGASGMSAGWYVGHEALMDAILTAPDNWLCTNDPAHSNANFDSGKCADCGKPLIV